MEQKPNPFTKKKEIDGSSLLNQMNQTSTKTPLMPSTPSVFKSTDLREDPGPQPSVLTEAGKSTRVPKGVSVVDIPEFKVPENAAIIKQMFPNFRIMSAEEIQNLSNQELATYINVVSDVMQKLNNRAIQLKTQLESKTAEQKTLSEKIKKDFGVETTEELEQLKQAELESYNNLASQLQQFFN